MPDARNGFLTEELSESLAWRQGAVGFTARGNEEFVKRRGYRNGSYARDLLTSYRWLEGLVVPRVR